MSTQVPPPTRDEQESANLSAALQDVSAKAQSLVREEIELAKAEVAVKVNAFKKAAIVGGAAAVFLIAALIVLVNGVAWALFSLIPVGDPTQGQFWWGFLWALIVFLVLAAVAGLLAVRFVKKGTPPKPELAIDEAKRIQETVKDSRTKELQR